MTYKTYSEDDLIMISALQHFVFCPRQCALIHIEQIWSESGLTAEGRILHDKVHEASRESRGKVRIEYGVPLRSLRLGLVGKSDVVEFHLIEDGTWRPFPVEYKRGRPKGPDCDRVQLCAQALCLEEMVGVEIPCGALFYGKIRRREDVLFDSTLRQKTEEVAAKTRVLIESGRTPAPVYGKRCESCSLVAECLPKLVEKRPSVKRYLERIVEEE